ncbi:MAG: FKBP-type peptidyl-prolyl cis-trans isomerase [Microscillaceae bacterium]|nr:FKBP-type peptidyl-prolyl cis-trans isomerase [Microscillaceae bacterium]MDW8459778.1 FKBP-type peptidyl-prolyl cis-trans isomerase [Cytophagales bacterium]
MSQPFVLLFRLFLLGFIFSLGNAAASYAQTNFSNYQKTAGGVLYRFIKQVPKQRKAVVGDIVDFTMAIRNGKDSLIRPAGAALQFKVSASYPKEDAKSSPVEVFSVVAEQDSLEVLISIDSLRNSAQAAYLTPALTQGTHLKYYLKILKIRSMADLEREQRQKDSLQTAQELQTIKKYIADNQLKAQSTPTGLHYVILQQGNGAKPAKGQTVVVHYTGMLLNGTKFDSSVDRGQPFEFPLGLGRVIKGWDEGIALLNVGTKAKLIIPSTLAYGNRGTGNIPPNSILIFDVELLNIR